MNNPYQYNIYLECQKGKGYPRYFTYTPLSEDEGEYLLTVTLRDEEKIIDKQSTKLIIHKCVKNSLPLNVLCIGDSMTYNGVWPSFGYSLYNDMIEKNNIKMIGTCRLNDIGYEGYGSWNFKTYCSADFVTSDSNVWVDVSNDLSEEAQHSIWINGNLQWILETITPTRLKFKRGINNYGIKPVITNVFKSIDGNFSDLLITNYEFEKGNPFWNSEKKDNDFKTYCLNNKYEKIDLVYILLSWNGLDKPFCQEFKETEFYIKKFLNSIHRDFPDAKISLLGIQVPSINGGITTSYGLTGPYSDSYGEVCTCFYYNEFLKNLASSDEFKNYVQYVDIKGQFDTEYNMPTIEVPVNKYSKITEAIGSNGVHPAHEGYLQIGDAFYRTLVADINKINNGDK